MSLIDHLEELRWRILFSVIAILVISIIAFFFSDPLLKILISPSGGLHLRAFGLMDGFLIRWRIAIYTGIFLAFPVWTYHLYCFINPGFMEHERRVIVPLLAFSLILFLGGITFGYYLLREMIPVLIKIFPQQVEFLPDAGRYISFITFFLLSCGAAFQLPTLLIILVRLHILNSAILRRQRRIGYFVLFVFAEIITPVSDPIVAPLTVMIPMVVLYEISIRIAQRIETTDKISL